MELNNKKICITLENDRMKIMLVDYDKKERKDKTFLLLYKDVNLDKVFGSTIATTLKELDND